MKKKAIYLKTNRKEVYALKNISRWIDAAYLLDMYCYIVCDSVEVKSAIEQSLLLYSNPIFIESIKNQELTYIVEKIANRNWKNTAYAHLTTFWHAKENGYDYFWNIDADDTRLCVCVDKIADIMREAERYAESNGVDCFSLDMWCSETYGKHWSFGITYTNGKKEWGRILTEHCNDQGYKEMDNEGNQNVDWFFTYLKNNKICKNETFYIENLRFIHYSNDFVEKPIASGLFHWKDGKLVYPFIYYGFEMKEIGCYDIPSEVVKLNIEVEDYEGTEIMSYYAREGKDISSYYSVNRIVNKEICALKNEYFIKKHGFTKDNPPEIICFGAGNALDKNIDKIRELYDLKLVCDNDESKWDKEIVEGIVCIPPDKLKEHENAIVIILVYSRSCVAQIENQLCEMGVKYDSMDNWLLGVE